MYPNLSEVIKYHPYHISTFAGFANVTRELFEAALAGYEKLTDEELRKIACYAEIPIGVLRCPHLIMLNRCRLRHQKMVRGLCKSILLILGKQKDGSMEAARFMQYYRKDIVNLTLAFLDNSASYAQYLGAKERVDQTIQFIRNEERMPRGLRKNGTSEIKEVSAL